jgi:hypothetical protein
MMITKDKAALAFRVKRRRAGSEKHLHLQSASHQNTPQSLVTLREAL